MKVLDGELSETQYAWPTSSSSSPKQDSSALSEADSSDITDAVVTHADGDEKRPDGKQMKVINLTRLCPNEVTYIHGELYFLLLGRFSEFPHTYTLAVFQHPLPITKRKKKQNRLNSCLPFRQDWLAPYC